MFCKVGEHFIECFRVAITKKTAFFAQKWPKNAILYPKTAFLRPEWSVVGPYTLFSGCWIQEQSVLQGFGADNQGFQGRYHQKSAFFWPKVAKKKPFFGLKQCFWGLSGHM